MEEIFNRSFLQPSEEAGKAQGIDLEMGRMSLPMLLALDRIDEPNLVHQTLFGEEKLEPAQLSEALTQLRLCGAVEEAWSLARKTSFDARFYLQPFPQNDYCNALAALAADLVNRSAETIDQRRMSWRV